jgi:hypothetical protein
VHLFRNRVVEFLETNAVEGVRLDSDIPAAPLQVNGATSTG